MVGMVNMMIIYIEKTIPKALDINNIILKNGDVSLMSPNLSIDNQIRPPIEILKQYIHWIFPYYEVSPRPPWVKIMAPPLFVWVRN